MNKLVLPELLSQEIVDEAKAFGSAMLADGLTAIGIDHGQTMESQILPVLSNMRCAGTAITVKTNDGDNFPIHLALYQCQPGYVMCIDGNGYTERALMGDVMLGIADAIGLHGVVIDGAIRDRNALEELGFPVYAKAYNQNSPYKKDEGQLNEVIDCGGVKVNPGDLVVGDGDGVVVVPRDKIEAVFSEARKKEVYEVERQSTMKSYKAKRENNEQDLPNLAPQWVLDMISKE